MNVSTCNFNERQQPGKEKAFFPSPADWRDQIVYQIFTDRFENGDLSLHDKHPVARIDAFSRKSLHGGNLPGIEQHLDYIRNLGATTIWISPVFLNDANCAYHGYGTVDFHCISPHIGGLPALQKLIRAAHKRGIYVLIDVICNHMGKRITSDHPDYPAYRPPPRAYRIRWIDPKKKYPPPFNHLNCFHNHGHIHNFSGEELILGSLKGLDDLRTERPDIRAFLINAYRRLITLTDCDGFRIDTVRHVEWDFWREFAAAIHAHAESLGKKRFFLTGEVFDSDESAIAKYLGNCFNTETPEPNGEKKRHFLMDSVTDYPLYYAVSDVFHHNSPPARLQQRFKTLHSDLYDPDFRDHLLTFLDNHDVPRFLWRGNCNCSRKHREHLLKLALVLLFTLPGIPCVYAGTELGFHGGHDPENRENMFGKHDPNYHLYRYISRLAALRRSLVCLRRGELKIIQADSTGPGIFVFSRFSVVDACLVIINTSAEWRQLHRLSSPFPPDTVLADATGQARPTRTDKTCHIEKRLIPPFSARVYTAASHRKVTQ